MAAVFHPFVSCFVENYFSEWISEPARDPESIRDDMAVYKTFACLNTSINIAYGTANLLLN